MPSRATQSPPVSSETDTFVGGAVFSALLWLVLFLFPGFALGQATLPWVDKAQPKKQEAPAVNESQLPLVRARIEGDVKVWVGQAVPLVVEVIVPTWFAGAPKFPDLDIPNAIALTPEGAVNLVVQSGGKTFTGQSLRYLVFPQAKGTCTIPPVRVEVAYALPGGKSSPPRVLASLPLSMEVRMPPGAEKAKYFLTAEDFRVSQSLNRKADDLRVGDAIERTITMTAKGTVGMSIPPLKLQAPDGVRVYPGVPKVTETADRGAIASARTETAVYVPENEGDYQLPEIRILCWNPRTGTMSTATVPPVELKVQAGAASGPEVFASSGTGEGTAGPAKTDRTRLFHRVSRLGSGLLAAALLFLALSKLLRSRGISLSNYLARRRKKIGESEAIYFRLFRKASLTNHPAAALRRLMFWLDRADTGPAVPTLGRFATGSGMAELVKATTELDDLLFAPGAGAGKSEGLGNWQGRRFYGLVARARALQRKREAGGHRVRPLIESLNGGEE